ncbi:MAG: CDP-diacylglycerol--serine O-phosphatidyltransferase [Chlamydiales bacterium 38-26]|nr:MAG: CDP-diacylglycerol--serine O-phosphatidyltransferase [Chlamydiales bacterium 38-26]
MVLPLKATLDFDKMKKVQLLPNVITAFGLTCGLFVIFKMSMISPGEVTTRTLTEAAAILILAAFADLLDGAIARAMKAQSEFGGLFDSLADAITFGVCPAVIILKSLSIVPGTQLSFFLTTAAMIYTVCGVLRLVRFNVTNRTVNPQVELPEKNKNFTGLPIPAAAAAAVSGNLLLVSHELTSVMTIQENTRAWFLFFMLITIGYFMISRWKFPSLKNLHIRLVSFQVVLVTVIAAVFIIYGMFTHFAVVFFVLSWAYLTIAWILSIVRMIAGKRATSLEDYEPEPEDEEEEI